MATAMLTYCLLPENVSTDLENFAKYAHVHLTPSTNISLQLCIRHAGRSTISTEDVMLLSRRNEGLEAVLKAYLDKQKVGRSKRPIR